MSKELTKDEIETARGIYEDKCADPSCFNYKERGVIYCVNHLHGFPNKIHPDDKKLLLRYIKQHGHKVKF